MDLATSIVQAAHDLQMSDKMKKKFDMELTFRGRHKYSICIIPSSNFLYLEFRGVSFKFRNGDRHALDKVLHFLCNEVTEDVKRTVMYDVLHNNYIPKNDPKYADICVEITYEGERKFNNEYTHIRPYDIIWYYIEILTMVDGVS
jgi:hypothetical protein